MSSSLSVLMLALVTLAAACSGAAPQALEMGPSGETTTLDSGVQTSTGDPGVDAAGVPSSEGQDSGAPFGSPAPSTCPPGGVTESGGNDTMASAQEFTSAACGTVSPGASDWWQFRLPGSATKLAVNYSGKVSLALTTQGTTIEIGSGQPIPFHPTANYAIEVTTTHGQPQAYVIVAETK